MGMKLEEEHGHENSERWLLTYADMITLCMAFFMVLYAMSQVDLKKYQSLGGSLQKAFHTESAGGGGMIGSGTGHIIGNSGGSQTVSLAFDNVAPEFRRMASRVDQYSKDNRLGTGVRLSFDERGMTIGLSDQLLFPAGSADLTPSAKRVLQGIATIVGSSANHIRIEGHTDNIPIRSSRYPSNWQLSTDRATNVIMYLLQTTNLSPHRLSAAGYGEYRPVVANDTPEHRAMNRRVDMVVLRSEYTKLEPQDRGGEVKWTTPANSDHEATTGKP